jgi:hypothetical protein
MAHERSRYRSETEGAVAVLEIPVGTFGLVSIDNDGLSHFKFRVLAWQRPR